MGALAALTAWFTIRPAHHELTGIDRGRSTDQAGRPRAASRTGRPPDATFGVRPELLVETFRLSTGRSCWSHVRLRHGAFGQHQGGAGDGIERVETSGRAAQDVCALEESDESGGEVAPDIRC